MKLKPPQRKIKAVAVVGSFLTAVGAGLAALSVVTWQSVGAVVVTAAISTFTGYQTASR